MESKEQLHDDLCEQSVLGTLLTENNAINEVREYLTDECFYQPKNQILYKAICSMVDRGDTADVVTIIAELRKMQSDITAVDICEICQNYTINVKDYAIRLADLNKRRQLANLGLYIYSAGTAESSPLNDVIMEIGSKLSAIQGESVTHIQRASDFFTDVDNRIYNLRNGIVPEYTHTGFAEIDKHRQFQPTNLIVVAADSSIGKTSFANCITLSAASNGCGVAYYSMEMTGAQQLTRLASIDSGIPYEILFNHPLSDAEFGIYQNSRKKIAGLPIYFDNRSSSSIDTIIGSIRSMVLKYHIGGVVVDYLQILSLNSKTINREQQLAEIARQLKNLAKELNIWITLLSQLNRNLENPEPSLERLRGSGQVNEAADVTALIFRPQYYNERYGKNLHYSGACKNISTIGTAQINIAKSRNSECYSFVCGFDGQCMRFYDLKEIPMLSPELQQVDNEPF
jgi:replicative DNA helicase